MKESLQKILKGYKAFKEGYFEGNKLTMEQLSNYGQNPKVMVVSCCDSRVDPGLLTLSAPGELFVVRNVANIVPPFESDDSHHGTSAALEFGIRSLKIKHLILLGHSKCGGIKALIDNTISKNADQSDFIANWMSIINTDDFDTTDTDSCAQKALIQSYNNCLSFPWIKEALDQETLAIHLWFFDIKSGQIYSYSETSKEYRPLDISTV
tara:strand:+ start:47056 stop:47682 length:627 start_codon:yes stop_codon:yes gene_type:complete